MQSNLYVKKSREYLRLNPEFFCSKNYKKSLANLDLGAKRKAEIRSSIKAEFNLTFLVGFPKTTTTLLDTILRSHSKINVVEEKPMVNAQRTF